MAGKKMITVTVADGYTVNTGKVVYGPGRQFRCDPDEAARLAEKGCIVIVAKDQPVDGGGAEE